MDCMNCIPRHEKKNLEHFFQANLPALKKKRVPDISSGNNAGHPPLRDLQSPLSFATNHLGSSPMSWIGLIPPGKRGKP